MKTTSNEIKFTLTRDQASTLLFILEGFNPHDADVAFGCGDGEFEDVLELNNAWCELCDIIKRPRVEK